MRIARPCDKPQAAPYIAGVPISIRITQPQTPACAAGGDAQADQDHQRQLFVFTPRGMRRTFNDLARVVEVKDVVTRSISGHTTEAMQRHYSTVQGEQQRQGIALPVSWTS